MNPIDVLITALTSLTANKMRASLTLLGVVIGVASVIVMVSMGQGVQRSITAEFEGLGANLITVTAGSTEGEVMRIPLNSYEGRYVASQGILDELPRARLEIQSQGVLH